MAKILDGIRVFDMTLAAVGPWASKLLGQLGADVIHVESPDGEMSHYIPPPIKGTGVLYISANYNKRHVSLDLKDDADRERAYQLIERCDVFVQNMRPGAAERLGMGYEAVAARSPGIVYVAASAYGSVGPMAGEAGVDPLLQAFCGWSSITGPPGGPGEMFRHYAHLDINTSSMIVEAVLAALYARERTGRGQKIEIEMLNAAIALQQTRLAEYFATKAQPEPLGSAAAVTVPHQAFRCEDQRWLAVGVERPEQWPALCRALGADELAQDPRFADNPGRVEHRGELIPLLEARFAAKPARWWQLRLAKERVPCSRILGFDELSVHPQVLANEHLVEIDTPHWGRLWVEGVPWRFVNTEAGPVEAGGLTGEHTAEVLDELGIA
ncbi:MAG: CaiB/BaiF CoA transferase family protein [Acidimicrobiales bacterium]